MQADIGRIIEQQPDFIANIRQYGRQVTRLVSRLSPDVHGTVSDSHPITSTTIQHPFAARVLEAKAAQTPVYVQYIPQNTETEVYRWLSGLLTK